jgi:CrcB protein
MSATPPASWHLALAIFTGAGCGAVLRWQLGVHLNTTGSLLPWGTLAANLLGGALIGCALAAFQSPTLQVLLGTYSPLIRAILITGFLGGLTTFSSFSAEVIEAVLNERWLSALLIGLLHLAGSLLLTALGYSMSQKVLERL